MEATSWIPANTGYFRGGGFSSKSLTFGDMPITMSRINIIRGLVPTLQNAEGWSFELPKKVSNFLEESADPGWSTTWFIPRLIDNDAFTDVYSVMVNWDANHRVFSYGHIGSDLITLVAMLRIPVCMHHVPSHQVFSDLKLPFDDK